MSASTIFELLGHVAPVEPRHELYRDAEPSADEDFARLLADNRGGKLRESVRPEAQEDHPAPRETDDPGDGAADGEPVTSTEQPTGQVEGQPADDQATAEQPCGEREAGSEPAGNSPAKNAVEPAPGSSSRPESATSSGSQAHPSVEAIRLSNLQTLLGSGRPIVEHALPADTTTATNNAQTTVDRPAGMQQVIPEITTARSTELPPATVRVPQPEAQPRADEAAATGRETAGA